MFSGKAQIENNVTHEKWPQKSISAHVCLSACPIHLVGSIMDARAANVLKI